MRFVVRSREPRILDFDLETIAAGFADPNWVPQKITCVAWSWIGEEEVHVRVCGPAGLFGKPQKRASMLIPFLAELEKADMVTGHNILRFDLPILQAECLRLNLPPLGRMRVQDTMRIVRTKGFKKGQDNLEALLKSKQQKLALNWQQWQDAYDEYDWSTIKERAVTDVQGHKEIRAEMLKREWLKPPVEWRP